MEFPAKPLSVYGFGESRSSLSARVFGTLQTHLTRLTQTLALIAMVDAPIYLGNPNFRRVERSKRVEHSVEHVVNSTQGFTKYL